MIKKNQKENTAIPIGDLDLGEGIERPKLKFPYRERRKNWFHIMIHFLAAVIILSFLFLLIIAFYSQTNDKIPDYFIAIVSTIIGFYFGSYLKEKDF